VITGTGVVKKSFYDFSGVDVLFDGTNVMQNSIQLTADGNQISLSIVADGEGDWDSGSMIATNGANLSFGDITIGGVENAPENMDVSEGAQVHSSGVITIGDYSKGTLTISGSSKVSADDGIIIRDVSRSGEVGIGSINLYVSNDSGIMLESLNGQIGGLGGIFVYADASLASGTYTLLSGDTSAITWMQGFGGTVNADYTFTVDEILDGTGGIVSQNLSGERYGFTFDGASEETLRASFGSDAGLANFSVLQLNPGAIGMQPALAAFEFTTDLTDGTDVLLSFFVGEGFLEESFSIWHKEGAGDWTLFTPESFTYSSGWVNFTVSGFSSYALTVVPEPSSSSLLLLAGAGYLLRRRKQ